MHHNRNYGVPGNRLVDARFTGPCVRMRRKFVQVRGVSSAPRCWVARE